ncbi:DUF2752 domain-containing protein [Myroides sp. NP-2]|uniref:DUF2752 domain-containing protein n=1 Tax=Myroides sp. NP-2 TaxID=2759945 RepID=UPI0015FA1EAE|nr:DUF2752 domain-containing protein [Myroides sp. NP-2]MBB1148998.1 DUF2752 domain-containing protein [Myroides sp. NP-2]
MRIFYRILLYVFLPLGLILAFVKGFTSVPAIVTCSIKDYTGLDCPGCGGQRAIDAIVKGELKQAFYYNQLIFVYLGVFAYIYVLFVETYVFKNKTFKQRFGFSNSFAYGFLGLILLFFIIRNV